MHDADYEPLGCTGKKPFPSPQSATMEINCATRPERRRMCVYHCRICGFWHYGNRREAMRFDKRWKNWHWREAAAE